MQERYETERLTLRPFDLHDAPAVQRIAGRMEIAKSTLNVPHPYLDGMAEQWIERVAKERELGNLFAYAVVLKPDNRLVGTVSLIVTRSHQRAEVAYWVDPVCWNQGIGTQAVRLLVDEGFRTLDLEKVWGVNFAENPASGRILAKLGFTQEGILRRHYQRLGSWHDAVYWGLLKSEWHRST